MVDVPEQIVVLEEPLNTGTAFTIMETADDEVHPLEAVPVTVYVVVELGFAITEVAVEEVRFELGDHT